MLQIVDITLNIRLESKNAKKKLAFMRRKRLKKYIETFLRRSLILGIDTYVKIEKHAKSNLKL